MLTVTEAAYVHLAEMLKRQEAPDNVAIRFVHEGERIALRPDSAHPDDITLQHEGRLVLLMGTDVSELLTEHRLEVDGTKLALLYLGEDE